MNEIVIIAIGIGIVMCGAIALINWAERDNKQSDDATA